MQAGPSSTRRVRPAIAASSVSASSRRLTNKASPHHSEFELRHGLDRIGKPQQIVRGAQADQDAAIGQGDSEFHVGHFNRL